MVRQHRAASWLCGATTASSPLLAVLMQMMVMTTVMMTTVLLGQGVTGQHLGVVSVV